MKNPKGTEGAEPPAGPLSHAIHQEVLLSLVRNSMDAIMSADGVIDYWNPAAEKLYGYTAAEAIGQPATLNVPLDRLEEFDVMRERLERGERIEQFATRRMKKDGSLVDVDISVFPVMDENGKLAATSVISHDLTEHLKLMKEVEQTAKLKADFLATMSHEIRTPLNAIIGTAELQLLSELTPQQRHRMGVIESSGELLLTIVDDILDFSKLSAGKLVIEEIDFNLGELVESLIDSFGAFAHSKKLALSSFIEPRIPTLLRGDSKRVRQILNNLLSNAVKFTSAGEVLLSTTSIEETAAEVVICFEVKDQGIGITPEVQKRLFQPFVQAEESTSRRFGGTGLGLAISKQLVEQMGGSIELDSVAGTGSTFRFTLRFGKPELSADHPGSAGAGVDFKGARALVVGDGEMGREAVARQLGSWGMETQSIAGQESAFSELRAARAQDRSYRLVLIDEGPTNEGLNLAKLIKTDAVLKDSKVVVMSSAESATAATGIFDSWLVKPIGPSILLRCTTQLFSVHDLPLPDSARPVEVEKKPLAWRKKVRVLVVEDNLTNQILIREQLGVLGYTVHLVGDAAGALGAINQSTYDVVLMDCELPGMSGYEAATEIRRREGNRRHLKVIALTAHVTGNQKQRCLDAGMDGYLRKPARLQALAAELDNGFNPEHDAKASSEPGSKNDAAVAVETSPAHRGSSMVVLDPMVLAEIGELSRATGRNIFRDLDDNFLTDLSPRVKLLRAALAASNLSELAKVAHPLKSASAIVGAMGFSDICANLERFARDGKTDQASSLTLELLEAAQILPGALLGSANYK